MNYIRIYTHTGGVVRFGYDMQELLDTVNHETQFAGRNILDGEGNIDLNKMSGPDDIDFVVRSIKASADVYDSLIPKHAKTEEFPIIVFSDNEITITLNDSGKTTRTVLSQAYEHTRTFMVNTMLRMWYEKVGLPNHAATYANNALISGRTMQRVLIHSFIIGRPYGSRYPKVNADEIARPLKGKFLGSYKTLQVLSDIYGASVEKADLCYIEAEKDYMLYSGSEWVTVTSATASAIAATDTINAREAETSFPAASQGDVYFITKGGTIGEYDDRIYAGEILIATADNTGEDEQDNLRNFIVLGPVRADTEN